MSLQLPCVLELVTFRLLPRPYPSFLCLFCYRKVGKMCCKREILFVIEGAGLSGEKVVSVAKELVYGIV